MLNNKITFPEKGMPESEVRKRLEMFRRKMDPNAGSMDTRLSDFIFSFYNKTRAQINAYPETAFRSYSTNPHPLAIEAITKFLPYNKNNIGTHTRAENPKGVAALERKVILMLGDLMGSANTDVDGYITQGGTEGNIMGLWVGRNFLRGVVEQKLHYPLRTGDETGKICLVKTSLTHYSIDKAADILDIKKVVNISLNDEYGMDAADLAKKIETLSKEGFSGFLIALTLGYNTTGTIDPVDEIDAVLKRLKNELNIKTYVHLDAAIGGLIYPFVSDKPLDFRYESVKSISLDMHKTGFLPHTAGAFLCRKNLQKFVERPVPYLRYGKDDSLSGSRPAAAAAACWSVFTALGKDGFRKAVNHELELKNYFLSLLAKENGFIYIQNPAIPLVIISLEDKMLPVSFEQKYGLAPTPMILSSTKSKYYYTLIFNPHMTKKAIETFVLDLKTAIR